MTTQDGLRATYLGNKPSSNRLQAAIPRTAQHSVHTVPQTDTSITLPCLKAAISPQTLRQSLSCLTSLLPALWHSFGVLETEELAGVGKLCVPAGTWAAPILRRLAEK